MPPLHLRKRIPIRTTPLLLLNPPFIRRHHRRLLHLRPYLKQDTLPGILSRVVVPRRAEEGGVADEGPVGRAVGEAFGGKLVNSTHHCFLMSLCLLKQIFGHLHGPLYFSFFVHSVEGG